MTEKKIAYIAGPITGVADYKAKFAAAEAQLEIDGYIVLNPARLPEGMPYEAYIPICLAMVAAADTLFMLPGAQYSKGAMAEYTCAVALGKTIKGFGEEGTT